MIKIFLAGASGFTGKAFVAQADAVRAPLVVHLRPDSPSLPAWKDDSRARLAAFDDPEGLAKAMAGCQGVLTVIGTTRRQFRQGVSYETVDLGTTVALLEAAKKTSVKHFVLLSSIGADKPLSSYLFWKRRTEVAVAESKIPFTIVRPSFLIGGERRLPGAGPMLNGLGHLPGLRGSMDDWRPIPIEVLAWNFLRILLDGADQGKILTGRDLWRHWRARKID